MCGVSRDLMRKTSSRKIEDGYLKEGMKRQEENTAGISMRFDGVPKRFSYDELSVATGGFSSKAKLGQGGFGSVYRGQLPSGPVAVKRMNNSSMQSQGKKEFEDEVSILIKLSHRNLIELRGWCEDRYRNEYMLVYELMPNGSLDDVLFKGAKVMTCLSWSQRFNILAGTAAALEYLHQGWKRQVIHRDVKCSNIMLDEDWNAKLGDFGIARVVDHEREAVTMNMVGTFGYIAPEVFSDGRFTDKADVYAFGVVVLEIACGRRVLPSRSDQMGLVPFVRDVANRKGSLLSMVDKQLTDYDRHQMEAVLKVGLLCIHEKPDDRPSMRKVVQMLARDVTSGAVASATSIKTKNLAQKFSSWWLSGPKPPAGSQELQPIDVSPSTSPACTVNASAIGKFDSSVEIPGKLKRSTTTQFPAPVEIKLPQCMNDPHKTGLDSEYFARLSLLRSNDTPKTPTIAIAVKAHEKFQSQPFAYVFNKLVEKGVCEVVVINCLSRIEDEMGVKHRVDVNVITGISQKKLELAVDIYTRNTNHFLRSFREQLDARGGHLEIWIATGPESHEILIQAARALNPHWLVLDRSFSSRKSRIKAALDCNLVLMRNGCNFEVL